VHHLTPVRFDRDLANSQLSANLFVQQAGDHQRQHLPFARRERLVTVADFSYFRFAAQNPTAEFKGLPAEAASMVRKK